MAGFSIVNLADVLKLKNEKDKEAETANGKILSAISVFSCPLNKDVEYFLRNNAVTFAEQGIAATYLVFTSYREKQVLIGYFTLANKFLFIPKKNIGSETLRKRISKFGDYNEDTKGYELSVPLIAQLGKNYQDKYNNLITGDELLQMACDKIGQIQIMLSGKLAYVECEDNEYLINFYSSHGFRRIADRPVNKFEKSYSEQDYLVQLIKYIKTN